ncbi:MULTISPECIES: helix-turn-helix and ligand-binding sensor domain-containing protein [Flavobacteriaceae]|uniref:LuxR family transcriptional regulator n=2 Tax=Flavobacteriaceae TaxID=49546 RepID=A0A4Y8AR38_9FLAO|nr:MULTISPECIES: triple tyrosine motif-containing protein [Flavobacteriaceae]TEW72503.1 LuxR family transcriptional regulator [Gramella jeungdoensis]
MRNIKTFFFCFLLFLTTFFIVGQELPPIENYSSKIYDGENQNWSVSQSEHKFIYIANNSGLLEFNGSKWRLYPSPNNTILRSVNAINNKIYTGAYMEFGFWEKNNFGNLEYTSLSEKLKESLIEEDFWNIIDFDKWILFQSLNRIYIYNTLDETFKIITSETQLPKAFKVDEGIYFQKMGKGVFKIENGESVLVSEDTILKNKILVNIFRSDEKILYQTQNNGFFYLTTNGIKKWDIKSNSLISTLSVYSSLQLANGSFILGTISNGIYQLDKEGNLLMHINQETGLNNNTVLSMFEDVDQNLWLGLDNGISVVNMNSPYRVYNDFGGKLGSVYTSAIFNNNLYLGTNQGLFYKVLNANADFDFIEGTDGQVWCFKEYDNTLFCGHNKGTFIVNNNKATLITDVMGTMEIKSVDGYPNILIQGYYSGLNVIEKINNTWQLRNKIEGFSPTSRFFDFTKDGSILVNHEYKGVFKLDVNSDFTQVKSYKILESAPKSLKSAISKYNGEILYASNKGIFKYNDQKKEFEKDPILSNSFLENDEFVSGRLVFDDKTNTLWGFTNKSIIHFSHGKIDNTLQSTKIFLPASFRSSLPGFESMVNLNNHSYLFGTSRGYFLLDKKKISNNSFEVTINSIEKSTQNEEKKFVPLMDKGSKFSSKENNLYFSYGVPEFDKFSQVNFQYQLKGFYNNWSAWSTDSEVSFKNLPYGSYTFNVKAQIGNNSANNTATYSFVIDRPWYLSNQLILIYSILFIGLIFLVHSLYRKYYSNQKQKLLNKKQQEFSMAQLESEKVIMKLKNEKLQQEIDSKTRELSASTMNIIKKNEILNTIKNELSLVNEKDRIKPVIKIINKNLSNTGDWKLFEEAFNNADSDFLKKIKTVHPNLTPNDLRLCAYLRLNLSSKEIAPLLNISPRSVEIKRYRLRKKMELDHEKSLVEYILEI